MTITSDVNYVKEPLFSDYMENKSVGPTKPGIANPFDESFSISCDSVDFKELKNQKIQTLEQTFSYFKIDSNVSLENQFLRSCLMTGLCSEFYIISFMIMFVQFLGRDLLMLRFGLVFVGFLVFMSLILSRYVADLFAQVNQSRRTMLLNLGLAFSILAVVALFSGILFESSLRYS